MAKMESDVSDVRFTLSLSMQEAEVLRELLWVTQLGYSGKAATASELSRVFDEAGLSPEETPGWSEALMANKIIDFERDEVGIYWVE